MNFKSGMLEFIRESNRIEGLFHEPSLLEIQEYQRFMMLREITLGDMIQFVSVYQPGAELRDRTGMDVTVGSHHPPRGDITIKTRLIDLLRDANHMYTHQHYDVRDLNAYEIHHRYEKLHPFMDGNGRSGRMLWLWMMREAPLGFLHTWYYQSLVVGRV